MNVAAAPQLDTVDLLLPDIAAAPGKQATVPAPDAFAFLSLLSWLTDDVLPPSPKADPPPDKPDRLDNKVKPDTRDPQATVAIELPVIPPPLKLPVVLEIRPPTPVPATPTPTPVVQDEAPIHLAARPTPLAFAATLTDRTKESSTPPVAPVIRPSDSKGLPPELTKPSVRTEPVAISVTAVEIGSTKPPTPANPTPPSAEPPKAELKTEINAPVRPQPTREISLKLSGAESGSVDVRITERAGKVQVDVRTPDGELARSLRADLSDLVGKLDKSGFDAKTWTPQNHMPIAVGSAERPQNNPDPEARQSPGGSQQQTNERRGGRPRQGRGRGFAEIITNRNEENHVNSN